jgi:putative phosphoesterase
VTLIAAIADTHVPDLQPALPARVFEVLRDGPVEAILHAGDISRPGLLTELGRIAPVFAVRGNRDLLWLRNWLLPARRVVEVGGVRFGLIHGHGSTLPYAIRRVRSLVTGVASESPVDPSTLGPFPSDVRVVVYGHDHIPSVQWLDSILFLNPGTASPQFVTRDGPTLALIQIDDARVSAKIVSLA